MPRIDPYMGFRFMIQIDGIIEGGFSEVSGLQATTQVEEFRAGGVNDFVYKLPKETKFENLILKKGLADLDMLWRWHRDVINGKIERKTVNIVLLKTDLVSAARLWSFKQAYPIKWSGPELKADANTIAFETLELAHHGYAA